MSWDNKHKPCYQYNCPKECNCHCTLTVEERIALTERFGKLITCLIINNKGIINFSFKNDPQFIEYCEYLKSLEVLEKLTKIDN
jgi:hypothetical protein